MNAPADPFADILDGNRHFAETFHPIHHVGTAARGLAVVTCLDTRIEPLALLGLRPGDAKIIRNAGARVTDDVLRSLIIATNLLSVQRIAVIAHTDCAATGLTEREMHDKLAEHYPRDVVEKRRYLVTDDQRATFLADLARIEEEPLIPASVITAGFRYDVETGRLETLVEWNEG